MSAELRARRPDRPASLVLQGEVVARNCLGSLFGLRIAVPGWRPANPGQFALLQRDPSTCFLPRAFSVHGQRGEEVDFLISVVGSGSEELATSDVGDRVSVLGPLGRGFDVAALRAAGQRLVVVAGGVGIAPFPFLLERLAASAGGGFAALLVIVGFRDAVQAEVSTAFNEPVRTLRAAGLETDFEVIAEDGSLGRAGLVTTLLAEKLTSGDVVVGCGAPAMCEAVWDLCVERGQIEAWFSLEARIACGVGSCQGCVIPLADGSLARVCRQGPVFTGKEAFGRLRDAYLLESGT